VPSGDEGVVPESGRALTGNPIRGYRGKKNTKNVGASWQKRRVTDKLLTGMEPWKNVGSGHVKKEKKRSTLS